MSDSFELLANGPKVPRSIPTVPLLGDELHVVHWVERESWVMTNIHVGKFFFVTVSKEVEHELNFIVAMAQEL